MAAQPTKAEMQKEIDQLKKELELAQRAKSEPMPVAGLHVEKGWLIKTLEPAYAGTTLGVPFKYGMAFLPYSEENAAKVYTMEHDLDGYEVTLLEGEALQALQMQGPEQALILAESMMRASLEE